MLAHLSTCDGKESSSEERHVISWMESVPHGRQPVHADCSELGAATLVSHVTEPRVGVFVPTGYCGAKVLREL